MPAELFPSLGSDDVSYPFATDLVSGVYWAYAKLAWGADGTSTPVSAAAPLPTVDSALATLIGTSNTSLSTVATNSGTTASAISTIDDVAGVSDKGIADLMIRTDTLSTVSPAVGDWIPKRGNSRGAQWFAMDTTLDATNDAVAIGSKAGQGFLKAHNIDVDESEDAVKASAGTLLGYFFSNQHASSWRYLKFYNATTANVTVGTTTPFATFPVPPASAGHIWLGEGLAFDTAITVAATTGVADNDTGAPGANEVTCESFYR